MRFIDLSTDGGCSKKAHAKDLRLMLETVAAETGSEDIAEIANSFRDAGLYPMQSETLVSTVDIVLPFIDDPLLFGEIAVQHALNDIYASLAVPLGALIILGIPANLSSTSPEVIKSLTGAVNALKNQRVALLGGHSLAHQQDFSIGFSIFGRLMNPNEQNIVCNPDDAIVVTKRLGTSIASLRWRIFNAPAADHSDVIAGMCQSNEVAANILSSRGIAGCTDVSGFGLVNNLHSLLRRLNCAAVLDLEAMPIYESVLDFVAEDELCTRQYYHNAENLDFVDGLNLADKGGNRIAWLDSQISGGLMFVCEKSSVIDIRRELSHAGVESSIIGRVVHGEAGRILVARNDCPSN